MIERRGEKLGSQGDRSGDDDLSLRGVLDNRNPSLFFLNLISSEFSDEVLKLELRDLLKTAGLFNDMEKFRQTLIVPTDESEVAENRFDVRSKLREQDRLGEMRLRRGEALQLKIVGKA